MVTEASKQRLNLAKSVSLLGLIKELGYKLEETGGYYRMLSPFRSEGKASVDIDKRRPDKWTDRGTGKRGDVIDFVQELFNLDKRDAIDYLLKRSNIPLPQYAPVKREQNSIEITHIEDLTATNAPLLIQYLTQRHISVEIACIWLKYAQIRFPYSIKNPNRIHHCLAWKNNSGGYEFRNNFLKVSNAPKDITNAKGLLGGKFLDLFEGWPDYLTYLSQKGWQNPFNDTIILNSVSFLGGVIPFIKDKSIQYWGHNDKAGDNAYRLLKEQCDSVSDWRVFYKDYKDLNDFVCGIKKPMKVSKLLKF